MKVTAADTVTRRRIRDNLRSITGFQPRRHNVGLKLAEVRITRTNWADGWRWVAMVIAADPRESRRRREIPITEGSHHHAIATLIRDAFPQADWAVAQDYDIAAGVLREHRVRQPLSLRGGAR